MTDQFSRRQFLGGTAAAIGGATAFAGEAAAHSNNDPVFAADTTWVRDGPGLDTNIIREVEPETGMHIVGGPWSSDGYTWWKYEVNGDGTNHTSFTGYEIQAVTEHADFIHPCIGQVTSTYWDCRDGCDRYHRALDIAHAKYTDTGAGRGGTVTHAGWISGYGNTVIIDHGGGFETLYAHFNNVSVSAGQSVHTGQKIGEMGNTGNSTGDHVHYEISYNGAKQNWNMDEGAYVHLYAGIPRNWTNLDPTYL